jgi:hypothetical protein
MEGMKKRAMVEGGGGVGGFGKRTSMVVSQITIRGNHRNVGVTWATSNFKVSILSQHPQIISRVAVRVSFGDLRLQVIIRI